VREFWCSCTGLLLKKNWSRGGDPYSTDHFPIILRRRRRNINIA
jgi:hypothetical protein